MLISTPGGALSHFPCCPALPCSQKSAPVHICYDTVLFCFCHAPDVTWVASVQNWSIRIIIHPRGSTSSAACRPEVLTACYVQNHAFNHDTKLFFFSPLTQHLRANLTHFWQIHSWICFNWIEVDVHKLNDTFVPTKVYYTTRCTQQWAALKCMFISGYVSVSVNRAFRSCKLLQLISFSHQQQITKGVICSLWTWVLIFVEMCTLFSCYCCWGKQWNLSILYP